MTPVKKIEGLIKRLQVTPGEQMHERTLHDVLQAHEQSNDAVLTAAGPSWWASIMQSKMAKIGAAAAILIGLTLMLYRRDGSFDISTPAFAQMIEAMEKMPWLHIVYHDRVRDYREERWFSYKLKILLSKYADGKVQYLDYPNNRRTVYDPGSDTVIISYMSNLSGDLYEIPRSLVDGWIEAWQADGAEIRHEKGKYEGVDVDIYYCTGYSTHEGIRYVCSQAEVVVDRTERVPILSEDKYWDHQGKLLRDSSATWDYPADGPKDVYAAGVARSAKVLDYSPTPELLNVMEAYRSHRDNAPGRYIAIVVYATDQVTSQSYVVDGLDIFYYNGIGQRRLEEFRFHPVPQKEFLAQFGDSFDSLMKLRRDEMIGRLDTWIEEAVMYDGKYRYSQQRSNHGESWSAVERVYVPGTGYRLPMGGHVFWRDILSELGWPNSLLHSTHGRGRTLLVENDYSRSNDLICVEVLDEELPRENTVVQQARGWLHYLNPKRDYICERQEIHPDLSAAGRPAEGFDGTCAMYVFFRGLFSVAEVAEYGQTDLGQQYPKKILMRSRWHNDDQNTEQRRKMITVYVDADPEFPEGIFDPGKLPKGGE